MCPEQSSAKKIVTCDNPGLHRPVLNREIRFAIESKLKACVVEDDELDHQVSVTKIDEGCVEFHSKVPFTPGSTLEIRIPTISRLANLRSPMVCRTTSATQTGQENYCIQARFTELGDNALQKLKDVAEKPEEIKDQEGFWRGY